MIPEYKAEGPYRLQLLFATPLYYIPGYTEPVEAAEVAPSQIVFGNTGLRIDFFIDHWRMHFTPEGYEGDLQDEPNSIKYSVAWAAGLLSMVQWYRELGENYRRNEVIGLTNERHFAALKSFFGSQVNLMKEEENAYGEMRYRYGMDLNSFAEDEIKIKKLRRVIQWAEKKRIEMKV